MTIETSDFLSGNSGALPSFKDILTFIQKGEVETSGRIFVSDLTTEELAGQYACECVDLDVPAYTEQIEYNLDFLKNQGVSFNEKEATDYALALLEDMLSL